MTHCTNNILTRIFLGATVAHSLHRTLLSPENVALLNAEIDVLHRDAGNPMEWGAEGVGTTQSVYLRSPDNWRNERDITMHVTSTPTINRLVQGMEGEEYTIGGKQYYSFNITVKFMRYLTHVKNAHKDGAQNNAGAKIHYRQLIRLDSH